MKNLTLLIKHLRTFFPALASRPGEQPACYFDNAATACVPRVVLDAVTSFYERAHGNVHRGVYSSAESTTISYEGVRDQVRRFLDARSSQEIIFTSGATDALNMVALAWAEHVIQKGDGILITQAEHHAHYVLWHEFARRKGAQVFELPIDTQTMCVDTSGVDHLLATANIKVAAVTTCSNVLGPLWGSGHAGLRALIKKVKKAGVVVVLDAAQSVAHEPISVRAFDCDFLAFSAHKMGGLTGLGVLYAREEMHAAMKPCRFGGGMVAAIADGFSQWQPVPLRFEAGTPPIAQVVGLGALLDFYVREVDFSLVQSHEAALCAQLIKGLETIPGVVIVGNKTLLSQEGHVVSFYVEDIHAHDIAYDLSAAGCCVRAGDHCAHPLSRVWQERATLRASFFMYNTADEVSYLITSLKKSIQQWRKRL